LKNELLKTLMASSFPLLVLDDHNYFPAVDAAGIDLAERKLQPLRIGPPYCAALPVNASAAPILIRRLRQCR
jgi:hypothetical protein